KVICSGRKVNLKDSFVERAEKRLAKLDKFFTDEAEANVTVVVEKNFQKVEITVRDRGFVVRAERSAPQMEDAFDAAADVLTQNIVKNRKRLSERLQRPIEGEEAFDFEEEESYHLIREKRFVVKPSTVEEAILQMNMLNHSFYLFRDADTDEINAVYARKDGSYGLLVPER
ncbi:ribosome-associated translation inhibitor RaiA, partial [Ruminococcaceae bacterium OttesenSCG-928-O06]|nr:ribosome-associated translation inhibitor RaiA [Ruminococcaceae bacterium OttesenSCG-928-O06]